jgi:hypothetical protein
MRRLGLLLLTIAASACSPGWSNFGPLQPGAFPVAQQVQVWTGRKSTVWHAVQVGRDSVSGIPYMKSRQCDSCRVSLPVTQVDSLRTGNKTGGLGKSAIVVIVGMVVVGVLTCGNGCSD